MVNRIPKDVDRLGVVFEDGSLVADAGLLVAATLMKRLGLEQLLVETIRLGDRPGGAHPGRRYCRWWRRCWWAVPTLIMPIGCGPVPPRGCCRFW